MTQNSQNILFVGNDILCCIAQGILTEMFYRYFAKNVNVESAVFSELSGSENSEKFLQIAKERGYSIDVDPQVISEEMLNWADHIFVMSSIQFKSLRLRLPQDQWPKFHIFMSYCFNSIEEPLAIYCKTNEEYQQHFDKIEFGCRKILLSLQNFV